MKRLLDIFISTVLLLLVSPLMVAIALMIKLDSPGPVIFKQKRGGLCGRHFYIYKFRTMCNNAERMGAGYKVTQNDSRITKIGKLLRATSLDELPQLFNIIKGDMSLVGPRPALVIQTDKYNDYQKQRLNVRPGVTGYAQVKGRNTLNWDERIEYDIYYVKNHNLWLDLKILALTAFKVLKSEGIYNDSRTSIRKGDSDVKK